VSVFGPAIGLSVQEVTVAIPSAPVAIGVVGSTVPLFTPVANVTGTPGTGLPLASLTITEGGKATAVPAGADWVTGAVVRDRRRLTRREGNGAGRGRREAVAPKLRV